MERSWAGVVRQHLLTHLPVIKLSPFFHESFGRPGKDLYVVMGALVLQQLFDLSDAAAVEAIAFNEAWHYALDARLEDDMYVCERTLRNYRAMVVAAGADEVLFCVTTDQLMKVFGVDPTLQRIDSTVLRSNMRKLTRLGVLCETIEKFLRELSRHDAALYARVDAAVLKRYVDGQVDGERSGCFGVARPSEAPRRLPRAAADLLLLVRTFAETPATDLPAYQLLQRVLADQCQVIEAGGGEEEKLRVKENTELTGDGLQNPSDPDSTYNGHKGQGYLAQIMETYTPDPPAASGQPLKPDLITHVAIGPMTRHDSEALKAALEDTAARGIAPKQVLGDTHYGPEENCKMAAAMGVELTSPAQPPKGSQQDPPRLSLEQFVLDKRGQVAQCPAGHAPVSVSTSKSGAGYQARFDAATCAACPLRAQCPVQKPGVPGARTIRLTYKREQLPLRQRRLAEKKPQFKERYRWRAGIEATMSRLKHQMGCAALRVRGKVAVGYEVFMGALGLNILRCARCVAINARG